MPDTSAVYQPRDPKTSQHYQCVEEHFETLEQDYDDRFAKQYGFLRPYVKHVIYRYLDCGILHNGFVPAGNALGVHVSGVANVATNTCLLSLAKEGTSATLVIRSGWWSLGSGSASKS